MRLVECSCLGCLFWNSRFCSVLMNDKLRSLLTSSWSMSHVLLSLSGFVQDSLTDHGPSPVTDHGPLPATASLSTAGQVPSTSRVTSSRYVQQLTEYLTLSLTLTKSISCPVFAFVCSKFSSFCRICHGERLPSKSLENGSLTTLSSQLRLLVDIFGETLLLCWL